MLIWDFLAIDRSKLQALLDGPELRTHLPFGTRERGFHAQSVAPLRRGLAVAYPANPGG